MSSQPAPVTVGVCTPADPDGLMWRPPWLPQVVLVLVTVAWGASFLVMKQGLSYAEPFGFVALRFAVAAIVMALLTGRSLLRLTRAEVVGGTLIGAALAAGNGLQTIGLLTINASTSAFLTALYVPLVPVLAWGLTRRSPSRSAWIAIALAFNGAAVMSGVSATTLGLGTGEVLTLLAAVAISAEILLLGRFAPQVDIRRLTVVQLAACALICASIAPAAGEPLPTPSWGLLATAGVLGVASALIQLAMSWAQSSINAVQATVIYAGEPMWAGLIAALAGEQFTDGFAPGAALVLVSLLVPAIRRPRIRPVPDPSCPDHHPRNRVRIRP